MAESKAANGEEGCCCREAMEKLFELLDGELTAERERSVRAHLAECPGCLATADFEERFLKAIHNARDGKCCPGKLRDKIVQALRAEGWTG